MTASMLALFITNTLFCSQITVQLMTASMVVHVTSLTPPGSDNRTLGAVQLGAGNREILPVAQGYQVPRLDAGEGGPPR